MQEKIILTGATLPQTEDLYTLLDLKYEVFLADSLELSGDRFVQIPSPDDASFAHKILKICLDNDFKAVVPQLNEERTILAGAKMLFSEYGIAVICPDKNVQDLLNDKSLLYAKLAAEGFSVPAHLKIGEFDSFVSSMLKLGYPAKRIMVEPITKRSAVDFRIVDDSVDAYGLLFPDIENPLISYTQLSKLLSGNNFPELLFSEHLEGNDYELSGYYEQGVCKTDTSDSPDNIDMILMQLSSGIAEVLKLNGCFRLNFTQTDAGFYLTDLQWTLDEEAYLLSFLQHELARLN